MWIYVSKIKKFKNKLLNKWVSKYILYLLYIYYTYNIKESIKESIDKLINK